MEQIEVVTQLGPIQKEWIQSLRNNPEKQYTGYLGLVLEDGIAYKACCLGEGLCVLARHNGEKLPFAGNKIIDKKQTNDCYPYQSYSELGLKTFKGDIEPPFINELGKKINCLSDMNDGGYSWKFIADFIENNPSSVFNESL